MRVNTNRYNFKDDYVEILTRKNQVILIDKDDFEKCKKLSWCVDNRGYANGGNKELGTVRLHRYILNPPKDKQVDHINHNKLDNRKCNLRIVTNQENQFNRIPSKNNKSGYVGVYYNKECKKWCCQITLNRKCVHSELFDTKEQAIEKRKLLEEKYYGLNRVYGLDKSKVL